eukprot:gene28730-37724_t
MPLMTLVSTAIDQIAPHPDITIDNCMKYLPTDSALFFTTDEDRLLLSQQRQNYTPVVKWFNKFFKVQLEVTNSIFKRIEHSPEATARVRSYLEKMVRRASRLEEEFQLEIWGVVEGGHDMDRLNNAVNLSSAGFLMQLLYDDATMRANITKFFSPIHSIIHQPIS